MTTPSPQPVPPAEQTTAAEPGVTPDDEDARPQRPELTPDRGDGREPRPSTIGTQEIRFALAFTGGVSLAIWMGGVARELDLLVQASDRRRIVDDGAADPSTPDSDPLRRGYRRLLDILDAQVAVDVLAGTSAGGINAALLGLVNVRRLDLGELRDIWLSAGDLGQLLRDPKEQAPSSLLRGDGRMLAELTSGIRRLIGAAPPTGDPRRTDVYITTTLLSPESSRFADDYGTEIVDTDHHALFHFDEVSLTASDVVPALALAARSSASFPAAFEPSFVRFGPPPAGRSDPAHPDMSPFTDATRSHWAADGGLLVNRPLAPLLQSVFDRDTDREVRRTLLYIVPSSDGSDTSPEDDQTRPLTLPQALLGDLGATLNQSIAADLAVIKEHNDRTRAHADTRLRLATLGGALPHGTPLADATAWADYVERQGDWFVGPLVTEIARQLATWHGPVPPGWSSPRGTNRDARLRGAAHAEATRAWPRRPPEDEQALGAAAALGRSAFDAAKATVLRLLGHGYVLAEAVEERTCLARLGMHVHHAFDTAARTDVRGLVAGHLAAAAAEDPAPSLEDVVVRVTDDYGAAQGGEAPLRTAWRALGAATASALPLLDGLARAGAHDDGAPPAAAGADTPVSGRPRRSLHRRRAAAAAELTSYVRFLDRGNPVAQLLDLHVAVRSVLPVLLEVEQPVELVQVSADTRCALAPRHPTAASKLTGMQMHHFGAFYKTSWRANDWMWGRLDGCGWLVHVLLDPRRVLTVMENDGVPPGQRAETFGGRLSDALERPLPRGLLADLAYLDDASLPIPVSLPDLALWAAGVLQQHVLVAELPVVAAHLRTSDEGGPSRAAVTWLAAFDGTEWERTGAAPSPDVLTDLLDRCPVAAETLTAEAEARTPLYLRTLTRSVAVATASGTGLGRAPTSLRPTFTTARAVTQTAYAAMTVTGGVRRSMTLAAVGLLLFGVLGMLTDTVLFGVAGVVSLGAGAILLAVCLGPTTVGVLRLLLALALLVVGATPWLPWLRERLYSVLSPATSGWLDEHRWLWPVVLFLVLLPPLLAVVDLVASARRRARSPA